MDSLIFNTISRADFQQFVEAIERPEIISDLQKTAFLDYLDSVIKLNTAQDSNPDISAQNVFQAIQLLIKEHTSINTVSLIDAINHSYKEALQSYDLNFEKVLDEVNKAVRLTNQNLPELDRGGTVPKAAVVSSTDIQEVSADYRGPIALFIPETHISDEPLAQVDGMGGITRHALKALNITLIDNLLNNFDIAICSGLSETVMDRSGTEASVDHAMHSDKLEAVNAFAHLMKEKGVKLSPSERISPCVKQGLINVVFNFVRAAIDGNSPSLQHDLFPLFEIVDGRPSKDQDDDTSLNIIRAQASELMKELGIEGMFKIIESKYMVFNPNFFNSKTSDDMLRYERELFDLYQVYDKQRNDDIAASFKNSKGIIPMIIGSNHLQGRLIERLKENNIPIIIVGAEGYRDQINL